MEGLAQAVREALDRIPASDLAVAKAAGISQPTLWRIRAGKRPCSPDEARAIADALSRWADAHREAEADLRRAIHQQQGGHDA